MLRDQTHTIRQRVNRLNRKDQRRGKSKGKERLGTTSLQGDVQSSTSHALFVSRSIPRALIESPEQSAINEFFTNFILIPRHPDGQRGFLECLYPLYNSTRPGSLLSLATSSVALLIAGGSPSKRKCYKLGQSVFGKALRLTSVAIQDPIESVKDETLLAIMILGFYDVRVELEMSRP